MIDPTSLGRAHQPFLAALPGGDPVLLYCRDAGDAIATRWRIHYVSDDSAEPVRVATPLPEPASLSECSPTICFNNGSIGFGFIRCEDGYTGSLVTAYGTELSTLGSVEVHARTQAGCISPDFRAWVDPADPSRLTILTPRGDHWWRLADCIIVRVVYRADEPHVALITATRRHASAGQDDVSILLNTRSGMQSLVLADGRSPYKCTILGDTLIHAERTGPSLDDRRLVRAGRWTTEMTSVLNPETRRDSRLKSYARAELSHALAGPASEENIAARRAICTDCDRRVELLEGKSDPGGFGWCAACGCGSNPRAALSVKLTLAGADCPLRKWGRVAGVGGSSLTMGQALRGIADSLGSRLSPDTLMP